MEDSTADRVLQRVISRLEKIERAERLDMSSAEAAADNCIASMQAEARAAITELRPLVSNGATKWSQRYVTYSCARGRHRDCQPSMPCDCLCHDR